MFQILAMLDNGVLWCQNLKRTQPSCLYLLLLIRGPSLKQLEDAGGCEPSIGINVEDVLLQAMGHVCCHTKTYLSRDRPLGEPEPSRRAQNGNPPATKSHPDPRGVNGPQDASSSPAPHQPASLFQALKSQDAGRNFPRDPGLCIPLPQPSWLLAAGVPEFCRYPGRLQFQSLLQCRDQHLAVCPG